MIIRDALLSDCTAIAQVHVDSWRTTYGGLFPSDYLDQLSYEQRSLIWQQRLNPVNDHHSDYFVVVAEDEFGQVIGFACGGIERTGDPIYQGELTAIYLLQPWQNKGLGRSLVRAVAKRLIRMNLNTMLIWALRDNPACQFYEKLGGQKLREKELTIADRHFLEIAYGWTDLTPLIHDHPSSNGM